MRTIRKTRIAMIAITAVLLVGGTASAQPSDALVTTGSPVSPFPQNNQIEPSIAADPANPMVAVAGSIDYLDVAPCSNSNCVPTPGVGRDGVYFTTDGGHSWTQPSYAGGYQARSGKGAAGTIGTVPNYYQAGFETAADPALTAGPKRGADGVFSYANGTTFYYTALADNISGKHGAGVNSYPSNEAITVSHTSDVARAAAGDPTAWSAPTIVNIPNESSGIGSDKPWIAADNAATSPNFGNVYSCFIRGVTSPVPMVFSRSTDGGATFSTPTEISVTNPDTQFRVGCTIKTDSTGVVYVAWEEVQGGVFKQVLTRSFDGGVTFETPRAVATMTPTGVNDPIGTGRSSFTNLAFDGYSGARFTPMPSLSIANGAPSGLNAPNTISLGWSDGRRGLNNEDSLVEFSTDGGLTFSQPQAISEPSDRSAYTAVALSPSGQDLYVSYLGFNTPFQTTTGTPRLFQGVTRHGDLTGASLSNLTTLNRGAVGDARAGGDVYGVSNEFLGDYIDITPTTTGAIGIYVDARRAMDCPAVDSYRQTLINGKKANAPAPNMKCPAGFGNIDIFASAVADPTP